MTLRPSLFSDFTGQAKVKERLEIAVAAAKQRGEALDHILLSGPPGLGKTTLANILAKAMGANLKSTSGPTIEKAGDLAGLLTNLEEGDVLFIDEIHRLQKTIEEYLYPAMEDFKLDIIIDQGPNARSVRLNLPRFTLIGATTRSGLLTAPLLTRFPMRERLDYYQAEQLEQIVVRSARLLNVEIDERGAHEIARRSRGTPRIANNLLRRVRDYAQVRHDGRITADVADKALAMLEIDQNGLDEMDKRILEADHREIRRRAGGRQFARRRRRRRTGHDRGSLRAVSDHGRLPQPHAARPRGDGVELQETWVEAGGRKAAGVALSRRFRRTGVAPVSNFKGYRFLRLVSLRELTKRWRKFSIDGDRRDACPTSRGASAPWPRLCSFIISASRNARQLITSGVVL